MPPAPAPPAKTITERIASIDICRGLTMLVMLFFNDINDHDLGNVQNVADGWRHMPSSVDGMTFPDVIFPVFLFLVGLSIPIALQRRIARGDSMRRLLGHVAIRSLALIFIGVLLLNARSHNPLNAAAMGMSAACWQVLLFVGICLVWVRYPKLQGWTKWLPVVARIAGAALLVYLVVIYRATTPEGDVIWMRTWWWGIIGLIGWTYLVAAMIWLACRDFDVAIMACLALLTVVAGGNLLGMLDWWPRYVASPYYLPSGFGILPSFEVAGLAAITLGGIVIALLLRPGAGTPTALRRIGWMLIFAAGYALAAYLLRPIWGIHKNAASPSWVLYSLAAACVFYALLHWLVDVKKFVGGTGFVAQAGSNTLLMYILHPVFYWLLALVHVTYLQTHLNEGWIGVARAAVVATLLFGVTGLLSRFGFRLQL